MVWFGLVSGCKRFGLVWIGMVHSLIWSSHIEPDPRNKTISLKAVCLG